MRNSQHILLVEDEKSIAEPLGFLLSAEGYQVSTVDNGVSALKIFRSKSPDLVLLDLLLPGMPGTEVCRAIRQESNTPIIMLTAKDSEADVVLGLEIGADDYIIKPYRSRELIARIRAVFRAAAATHVAESAVLTYYNIRLDSVRHELIVRGMEVIMPRREFELLELLMRHAGQVLTREQLIDRIWGSNYYGDTKTLDVHIKRLRGRIEENPGKPRLITTIRGIGYRFG